VYLVYIFRVSHYHLYKRVTSSLPNPYATSFAMDLSSNAATRDVALPNISKPLVPL